MIRSSLEKLQLWFAKHHNTMVALSGGVDSCLVAYLGRYFSKKDESIAVIGDSPSLKRRDFEIAKAFCSNHDITYIVIHPEELNNPKYAANPTNRCYFCKSALYDTMIKLQKDQFPEYSLLNGNNYDDKGDYRPGMEAARENQSLSPLLDCGITKNEVRALARHFKLEVWDKPASPCLSSRFPYGESINKEKLALIEKAETFLFNLGFKDCRVRYYKGVAKIEVSIELIDQLTSHVGLINEHFSQLGFSSTEIDTEGLVSGKLNRVLDLKLLK